ncbi:hypothetical protein X975_24213, partial [Stegodyphus mimosarum]
MFPYSCRSGQTLSKNWQKSFLIPNHQWFPPFDPNANKIRTINVKYKGIHVATYVKLLSLSSLLE